MEPSFGLREEAPAAATAAAKTWVYSVPIPDLPLQGLSSPTPPSGLGERGGAQGGEGGRLRLPRAFACDEDEDPADGDEAVLQRGHGQDGELRPVLQGKHRQQPPAPGRPTGIGLGREGGEAGGHVSLQPTKL